MHLYVTICMKLDPGMHIGMHLVSFRKSGVPVECSLMRFSITFMVLEPKGKSLRRCHVSTCRPIFV
jgi:hypothetical protein